MSTSMYNRAPPSRATATTLCQKCLQRGHYSYECKTKVADRPYKPRPSRTQQLLNPKLKPKLTEAKPDDLTRKDGVADEILRRAAAAARSRSASSDDSVATISTTGRSPSRSPARGRNDARRDSRLAEDPDSYDGRRSRRRDRSPSSSSSSGSRGEGQRRRRHEASRGSRRLNERLHSVSPSPSRSRSRSRDDRAAYRSRADSVEAPRREKRRSASPRESDRPTFSRDNSRRDFEERYAPDGHRGRAPHARSPSPYSRRRAITHDHD